MHIQNSRYPFSVQREKNASLEGSCPRKWYRTDKRFIGNPPTAAAVGYRTEVLGSGQGDNSAHCKESVVCKLYCRSAINLGAQSGYKISPKNVLTKRGKIFLFL